jgi:elongation factor 2
MISSKRGTVIEEMPQIGTPLVNVKAHLPVASSFGFTDQLRLATYGQAFPTMAFDHWEVMSENPLEPGTRTYDLVKAIRQRKGLKEDVPPISEYEDRL